MVNYEVNVEVVIILCIHIITLFFLGDIKDGDIVQSLTSQVAENVVSIAFNVANSFGIKKMLFCGNFVRPDCIKPLVSTAVYVRNARTTQVNIR